MISGKQIVKVISDGEILHMSYFYFLKKKKSFINLIRITNITFLRRSRFSGSLMNEMLNITLESDCWVESFRIILEPSEVFALLPNLQYFGVIVGTYLM